MRRPLSVWLDNFPTRTGIFDNTLLYIFIYLLYYIHYSRDFIEILYLRRVLADQEKKFDSNRQKYGTQRNNPIPSKIQAISIKNSQQQENQSYILLYCTCRIFSQLQTFKNWNFIVNTFSLSCIHEVVVYVHNFFKCLVFHMM